jgi:hypothetical protein
LLLLLPFGLLLGRLALPVGVLEVPQGVPLHLRHADAVIERMTYPPRLIHKLCQNSGFMEMPPNLDHFE